MVVPKPSAKREKLLKRMADKDELEAKIKSFGEILEQNGNVGMSGPLLDSEGFPRNDIDVYQVRQARQQIICLQNDYKELMKEIEELLHQLHAEQANQHNQATMNSENVNQEVPSSSQNGPSMEAQNGHLNGTALSLETRTLAAIVKVNLVSPGSPAEDAGLRLDDEIIEFGSINSTNFNNNLNTIGTLVRNMENQRIALKVKRGNEILELILIPKTWSGRGLLGCNIVLP